MGRRRTRVEQAGARAAERSNVMESSAVPSALTWSRTVGRRNRDSANVESSAVPSAVLATEPSRFRLYTAPGREALLYPFGRDRDRSRFNFEPRRSIASDFVSSAAAPACCERRWRVPARARAVSNSSSGLKPGESRTTGASPGDDIDTRIASFPDSARFSQSVSYFTVPRPLPGSFALGLCVSVSFLYMYDLVDLHAS